MRIDASVPVVVLGFHHGGLGIARSLGRLGVSVHGVDANPEAPALASRYCRGRFHWNFHRSSAEESLAFLEEVARSVGTPALLVPTSDDGAAFAAEHRDRLAGAYLYPRVDPALVRSFSDKRALHDLAGRHGVPTATAVFPTCRSEVLAFAEEATFPLMLKGIDGLRLERRTGRKMVIVQSPAELLHWYDVLEDGGSPNLMLQEYIPGGDDTIWMFNGYFDERSKCVAGFTGRKLRQHPIHTGATSLGICERNDVVSGITEAFMKATGYRGILDIGYRFDARDGQYKLLDPNPRIGSTFRLFVDENGMDVARYLYLDLTGQPLPEPGFVEGRKWFIENLDLESSLDYAREGSLGLGSWLHSFRGVREAAWFARDDLAPFARVAGTVLRRAVRRLFRRARSAPPAGRESRRPEPAPAPPSRRAGRRASTRAHV